MRRLITTAAALLLAACVSPGDEARVQKRGVYMAFAPSGSSATASVSSGLYAYTDKYGPKYMVSTKYITTGVAWPSLSVTTARGQALPYTPISRVKRCPGNCRIEEAGFIDLTRDQYEQAAQSGFEFKMTSRGDSVSARMPAEPFRLALDKM